MTRPDLKKRGIRTRKRNPITFIICEGEETEPNYFKHFRKRYSGTQIVIKTSPYKNAWQIVSNAEQIIGENVLNAEDGDTLWWIFDCDANTDDELKKSSVFAKEHGYRIIFSNPCFELRFLLHYVDQRGYLKDCDVVLKKLTDKLQEYRKNADVYEKLLPMQKEALVRAKNRYDCLKRDNISFTSRGSNPATNVFSIVEYLNESV